MPLEIRQDDLSSKETQSLIRLHLEAMHEHSPPGSVYALDDSALRAPDVTLWSAWDDGTIAGMGALKQIDAEHGEVKSMRTHPDHMRKGIARALLEHIVTEARARGYRRLSLETGSGPAFDPALTLYQTRGFEQGAPFGDYRQSTFNQFLYLAL